jgi:hypothetical protein
MSTQIRKNRNLHGNVPDCYPVVFLPVDATNGLVFLGNSALPKMASRRDGNIAALEERCQEIPAIYANDNRDKWRSDFSADLSHCLRPDQAAGKCAGNHRAGRCRGKGFSVCQDCQPESAKGQRRRRGEQTGETFGFKNITQSGKQRNGKTADNKTEYNLDHPEFRSLSLPPIRNRGISAQ